MSNPKYFDLQLSGKEIDMLMKVLEFSRNTSSYLEKQELKEGTESGVRQMATVKEDSTMLLDILVASIQIGEPPGGVFH